MKTSQPFSSLMGLYDEFAVSKGQFIQEQIRAELGFVPPFFLSATQNPQVLQNLWQQTLIAYLHNPLPALFKEQLSAYLSRFCAIPYCMICHSCSLHALGMDARDVLTLLESPPPTELELEQDLDQILNYHGELKDIAQLTGSLGKSVLNCAIFLALQADGTELYRDALSRLLGTVYYQHLVTFIAYVKTCHVWMESNPETAYQDDERVRLHFQALTEAEPELADFFVYYWEQVKRDRQTWAEQQAELRERRRYEGTLRKIAEENRYLAQAMASTSEGVLITDPNQPDNPVIYANPGFSRMTGYELEEILGQNCRFLQGEETDPQAVIQLQRAIAERREITATLLNYRKDGQPFWNELRIAPVFSDTGKLVYFVGIQTDISQRVRGEMERKRAEESLRQSELTLRSFFNNTSMMMGVVELHGDDILHISDNAMAAQLFGRSPDAMQNQWASQMGVPRPYIQQWIAHYREAERTQRPVRFEYSHQTAQASVWLSATVSAIATERQQLPRFAYVVEDITERKHAEEALRKSEERFHLIAQVTNDAVWEWNLETNAVWWNEGIQTLFGYSPAELGPDVAWWYDHIHPEDRDRIATGIEAAIASDASFWGDEYYFQRADGCYVYVCDRGYIIRNAAGQPTRMIGGMTDMSDRKQAEKNLAQQAETLHKQAQLLDLADDAIVVCDMEDRITFWNQGAEKLYGWLREDVLGQHLPTLLKTQWPQSINTIQTALFAHNHWEGELVHTRRDGKQSIVTSRWALQRDKEGNPTAILKINHDITEKKALESQFLRAQRMESIGTLAGGIAHDLNNILTPILSSAQLLLMKTAPEDTKQQQLLQTIHNSGKRGAALIKQVLSFARGVEGKRAVLQVRHLISEIRQIVQETFPKSIEMNLAIARDLWLVSADATQLHQVLMNLCVNARDAMADGGSLSISAANLWIDEQYTRMNLDAKVGPHIVITVADTGTGIAPDSLDRIFEPFFTTKELSKGTGLGLSTVLAIVKSHGGFIDVSSTVGQGTEFKIYLPAVRADETQIPEEQELPLGQGELILVVDDEAMIRESNQASLETYQYQVLTASDGIEAIALFAEHKHDIQLALVDLMMPAMDGLTAIRTLRKINPQVKIIAVSGLVTSNQMSSSISSEIHAFLPKPYTAKELVRCVTNVLHQGSRKTVRTNVEDI